MELKEQRMESNRSTRECMEGAERSRKTAKEDLGGVAGMERRGQHDLRGEKKRR